MKVRTIVEILDAMRARPRPDLLRYRAGKEWRALSTEEFDRRVRALCGGLVRLGVGEGDRVALLSENRPEWHLADSAIQNAAAVTVPVYPTLPPAQIAYILKDSGARVIFASTAAQFRKIEALAGDARPASVILFDPVEAGEGSAPLPLEGAEALGAELLAGDPGLFERRRSAVRPESLASIIYTSGTTAEPKGVMLTHANFASNIESILPWVQIRSDDQALTVLPLSHIFERCVTYGYLRAGASLAYVHSLDLLASAFTEIEPTLATVVPRLLEKIKSRIEETVRRQPAWRRALFRWAMETGRRRISHAEARRPLPPVLRWRLAVADRLVLGKIRGRFGRRLRFLISGGAALPRDVGEFFISAGVLVIEGYGLTETSPVVSVNRPEAWKLGTVGPAVPGTEVRISEDGEVLVRGPNVMKGYWNRPEATAAVMEGEWFHTGDAGRLDEEGYLTITGRRKEVLVTSGGKNVSPLALEGALKGSPYIASSMCVGDGQKFISALIVPEFGALRSWAAAHGLPAEATPAELVGAEPVRALYRAEIDRLMEPFAQFERVRRFALIERDFSIETGEMTPTLKVKRWTVAQRYAPIIQKLYEG